MPVQLAVKQVFSGISLVLVDFPFLHGIELTRCGEYAKFLLLSAGKTQGYVDSRVFAEVPMKCAK